MTPYSLAFYIDVVASGSVLGAKPSDTPGEVAAILGADFVENSLDKHSLWRDYGITEFFWARESPEHPWVGTHFTLQVHRLSGGGNTSLDRVLREKYGRFNRKLRFEKLRRLLENRGIPLVEIPDYLGAPYSRTYWQPDSLVQVKVVSAHEEYVIRTPDRLRIGDVSHISAPLTPEVVEWLKLKARQAA